MCKTAKEVWHTLIITHQGNSQVKNCKIDLLTQEYKKFSISSKETIDNGFTRFNDIVTSLKSLDPNYSSKNHVRKFLCALPLKWRAKVTTIEEAKDLTTLPLDELVGNLKLYEMVLDNDGVVSKTTKEKVKSLALKAKVTREQNSDDSNSQGESTEDVDEEEAKAFNLLARNFRKFFRKGNRFGRGNRFGNGGNWFSKGRGNSFGNKGGEISKPKGACYNCGIEGHFAKVVSKPSSSNIDLNIIDLQKENEELLKFNKDFAKTFEKLLNEKRSLEKENSKLSSKINDLQMEVKKLANDKEVVKPCKTCDVLTNELLGRIHHNKAQIQLLVDPWVASSSCLGHHLNFKETKTQILECSFKQQDDDLKKKLAKNNEAKMVLYNALPKKEYERIFMCKMAKDIWQSLLITHQGNSQVKDNKIDLLVQQYEQFTILEEESIDSGFARFNTIITSLKALDEGFSSKNYVRKFLRALHPKWRAKVTTIEESKDLSSLALDELIGNLKVHVKFHGKGFN
ncbi:UBN2 domain-containing protein [Tanacetum coccineum]